MKKFFQLIGLVSLICFSFFVTEKTAIVVSDLDNIMVEIKSNYKNFNTKSIDAVVNNSTIISGIASRKVNIKKSYKNMKKNGYYSESLYVYDYSRPNISLEDNIDKYIVSGNPKKNMVSLIFTVKGNQNITDILTILNNYNIKTTFFVDNVWLDLNTSLAKSLINDGHILGILLEDYTNDNFTWMDMVIKRVNKQTIGFCYNLEDNVDNIKECVMQGNYTIRPIKISDNIPLVDIKEKMSSGSILSLTPNSKVKKELSTIIIYIKSKGFTIANLDKNVLE